MSNGYLFSISDHCYYLFQDSIVIEKTQKNILLGDFYLVETMKYYNLKFCL